MKTHIKNFPNRFHSTPRCSLSHINNHSETHLFSSIAGHCDEIIEHRTKTIWRGTVLILARRECNYGTA